MIYCDGLVFCGWVEGCVDVDVGDQSMHPLYPVLHQGHRHILLVSQVSVINASVVIDASDLTESNEHSDYDLTNDAVGRGGGMSNRPFLGQNRANS